MADLTETVVTLNTTFYRLGSDNNKTVTERFKSRIILKSTDHHTLKALKLHIINFVGIKELCISNGIGDFELKIFHLVNSHPSSVGQTGGMKVDNLLINTQPMWDVERPALLQGIGELNGKSMNMLDLLN
jgi:hypothetical protein